MNLVLRARLGLGLVGLAGCATGKVGGGALAPNTAMAADDTSIATPKLPPVPLVRGPIAIRVIYPSLTDRVEAGDMSFIFGSVGTGDAVLTINGQMVQVWPNGAWLGWIAFPPDSVMSFDLVARNAVDSSQLTYEVRRNRRFMPPDGLWIDSLSISPRGRVWWPANDYLPISVRAAEGSQVQARLTDGSVIPFVTDPGYDDVSWGIRAFDRDTGNLLGRIRADRYVAVMRSRALGPDPGPLFGAVEDEGAASVADSFPIIEAIQGTDTARVSWPVRLALLDTLPALVQLDDDTARTGATDGLTVGRALPGGTYHWFFPTGTRTTVIGRMNSDLRLRLSSRSESWIAAVDAHPLPTGRPPLRAVVGSTSLTPSADRVSFRIPLSQRVPFQIAETERGLELQLYSAVGDVNWIRYGGTDPLVKSIAWTQPAVDEVTIRFDLASPVWGYRSRWQQNDLILEIRRPPRIDQAGPFIGLRVVVDPGHPPAGATGPTGLREAEANLAVSLELRRLLQEAGAQVIMTRTTNAAVDLFPRVKLADSLNADILISIHNNALPDGVNPFTNNGTSVFYNHPRSIPLAMAVQRALVRHLGLPDLGIGRGDLALVRPTWMPAILTEGLFMMLPEQEAALRQPEGQRLYARGVFEGIEEFLRWRATEEER